MFLVLPLPCVRNSRYLSNELLVDLMRTVGFELVQERWKEGGKVGYWLWAWRESSPHGKLFSKKQVVHEGSKRNNFAIVLP
jgi:25S rRNA (adenine2142-N1)-methyltransferase